MKIYIIVRKNRLISHSYILKTAYKDLNTANRECYKLNKKAQKSEDPFVKEGYYDITIVEVEDDN